MELFFGKPEIKNDIIKSDNVEVGVTSKSIEFDVIVHYKTELRQPNKVIYNVEEVCIDECSGVTYVEISYYPCGLCEDDACDCHTLSVYIDPSDIREIEEVPKGRV